MQAPSSHGLSNLVPIVFVDLGRVLPSYARINLSLLASNYSGPIHLVTSEPVKEISQRVVVHQIGDWYSKKQFERFAENSTVDQLFRQGFWLHAAERLFVLAQFARKMGFDRFFHAELDVLIYDLENFAQFLDSHGEGIFCPPEGGARALASLVYCNSLASLNRLLDFFVLNASMGNEMKLLGHFLRDHPEDGHALASDRIFDPNWPFGLSAVSSEEGLVDSSGFGQWLFGPDPRNQNRTTWTGYQSRGLTFSMNALRFKQSLLSNQLSVRGPGGETFKIRAVHIHSKMFSLIKFRSMRWLMTSLITAGLKFPVSVSFAGWWALVSDVLFSRRAVSRLRKLPLSSRSIAERLLIRVAGLSPSVLSERKLATLNHLQSDRKAPAPESKGRQISFDEIRGAFPVSRFSTTLDFKRLDPETLLQLDLMFWGLTAGESALVYREPPSALVEHEAWKWRGNTPVFLSSTKHYESTRVAVNFWPDTLRHRQWSFNEGVQLIEKGYVAEMFPEGVSDIISWVNASVGNLKKPLSALHTYGLWVRARKRSRITPLRSET